MNASIIAMFFVSLIAQAVGLNLLPYTKGLTSVPHTIGMFVAFALGLSLMSRVVNSGVNVSSIVPLMATAIPLSTIIFGVAVLGESASPLKILLLFSACGLVLVASYTH